MSAEPHGLDTAHLFAVIARDIAARDDVEAATDTVVTYARSITDSAWTSLARLTNAGVTLTHGSDAGLTLAMDQVVRAHAVNPLAEVVRTGRPVNTEDLSLSDRYRSYGLATVDQTKVRAELVLPLSLDEKEQGALVFWSDQPAYFGERVTRTAEVFTEHATLALAAVRDHAQTVNLTSALENSRDIGAAIGVIMASSKLPRSVAFEQLRQASQRLHRKLHDVALDVLETGVIPEPA